MPADELGGRLFFVLFLYFNVLNVCLCGDCAGGVERGAACIYIIGYGAACMYIIGV